MRLRTWKKTVIDIRSTSADYHFVASEALLSWGWRWNYPRSTVFMGAKDFQSQASIAHAQLALNSFKYKGLASAFP